MRHLEIIGDLEELSILISLSLTPSHVGLCIVCNECIVSIVWFCDVLEIGGVSHQHAVLGKDEILDNLHCVQHNRFVSAYQYC